MVQFHKLTAIGLAIAISSGNAFALGLGEVTWKSTLNQPLNAEIALYDVRNVTNKELVVKLASTEAFEKAGLERPHSLTNLVFTPIIRNGKGIIKITSNNPIQEPYIDFLLSVSWATGETLREYTLLIDPPTYQPAKVATVSNVVKPTKQPVTKPIAVKPVKEPAPKNVAAVTDKPVQKKTEQVAAGSVRAHRGSSLWSVAQRSRGNASIHQAMLAIYEANPDAFIDGKMSLLKEGSVLRIPSREQMRTQNRTEALSQILANVNGTAPKDRQINASKTPQLADNSKNTDQDELKITGVSDTKKTATKGNTPVLTELNTKVSQVEEDLDATVRKNTELRSRMDDLEARLNDMKQLITLKNNQLAALQASMKQKKTTVDQPLQQDEDVAH